uniref:carboxylesterase n=1 Tax=Megaselia scalaris TaxID=36166 RepID=T1GHX5_MEGSC
MLYRIIIIFFAITFGYGLTQEIIVETPLGPVAGISKTSANRKVFYSFLGLPYAEPPKRFEPSEPKKSWASEILNATINGKVCPQPQIVYQFSEMSEDCLFLNVHTPGYELKEKFPVLFYIH